MHPNIEIFDDKLRIAFVNRALRRNQFNEQLKVEIEDSVNFRLECFKKDEANVVYISDFTFSFDSESQKINLNELDSLKEKSVDVLVSIFQLQSVNDIVSLIGKLKSKLVDKGILILLFPGNRSFVGIRKLIEDVELRILEGASPRFFPMIDVKDAGALAYKSGFKNVISDVDEIIFPLESLNDFANLIRNTGLANCIIKRDKSFLKKDFIKSVQAEISNLDDADKIFQIDLVTVTAYNP